MRKILVVTGTRAEYGLLYWTMKAIQQDNDLQLQLIVTGSHLSTEYGYTVEQIRADGFTIEEEIDMLIDSQKKSALVKAMGLELIQMAQVFDRLEPDLLLILGDRYETFIAAICAMMMNVPIAHMNGGESTEGAIDEQIRHAITKMAHLHFTGAEPYKENVIKMGEEPWRVFNVGQAGLENIKRINLLEKEELEAELKIKFGEVVFLITYHPETIDYEKMEEKVDQLLSAISKYDAQYIFTYPNADFGNRVIIDRIKKFIERNQNAYLFSSLGQKKYLSLLKYVDVMIGNSSSGIIESPAFKLPVVNIGERQKGRLRNRNIIDVSNSEQEIADAINKAINDQAFIASLQTMENLYGEGRTSESIINVLKTVKIDHRLFAKALFINKD